MWGGFPSPPFSSPPSLFLPLPLLSPLPPSRRSGGALKLPQRVRAEPCRQTFSGAFRAINPASGVHITVTRFPILRCWSPFNISWSNNISTQFRFVRHSINSFKLLYTVFSVISHFWNSKMQHRVQIMLIYITTFRITSLLSLANSAQTSYSTVLQLCRCDSA